MKAKAMAEEKKKAKSSKPIADVAHPDKTAADPTAKPIIVTNRPIMKDPMVKDGDEPAPAEPQLSTKAGSVRISVKPLSENDEIKKPEPAVPNEEPEPEPEPDAPAEKPAEEPEEPAPEEEKPQPAAPDEQPASDGEPEPEANNKGDAQKDPAAIDEAEAAKQAEHDAALQKLADEKQYYLPIDAVEKRKSRRFVLLGLVLSLLLVIAWADIALDAGLIQISGIKPVTHFFSN